MVLTSSGWIASCKLGQGQGAASDCESADEDAVDDGNGAAGDDAQEQGGGETAPAVADIETGGDDVEKLENPRRRRTAEDCC
jgi:hypothetical protein